MVIETLYDRMGGMGRFQVMTSILIALCQVPAGWSMLQMTFAGVMPDFYCLTGENPDNVAESTETGRTQFAHNETFNECSVNGTICGSYSYVTSAKTVITEFGLVCGLKWTKKIIISIQMAGVLLGSVVAGQFSDLFGRKTVLYSFAFLHILFNIICGFSIGWVMFAVLRFFIGVCIGSIVVVVTPYQMEFLPVKWRSFLVMIPSFPVGLTFFAGAAAWLENWSDLHFACAGLCLAVFLCGWFVPESPRWLAVCGKEKDAERVIAQIAKMNRKPVPEDTLIILRSMAATNQESNDKTHRCTYVDLFKKKFTAKLGLVFFYYWFILAVVYYGISFGVGSFVGNLYFNIFLLGIMEIPAQVFTFFLSNKIGRRKTTLAFFVFCFVSLLGCLLFHFLSAGYIEETAINVLSLFAKMMVGCAWASVHIWGTELFPTVVRNLGCGFSSLGARVGGILAPFMIDFDEMMSFSYGILCILLAVGTLVVFAVPDTKGKVLNDHIKDNTNSYTRNIPIEIEKKEVLNLCEDVNDNTDKEVFIPRPENTNVSQL